MPTRAALAHIPGPPTPPFVGHTLMIARDSYGTQQEFMRRYGTVYKTKMLGVWRVNLCGPDALEMVLMDKDKIFSSEGGWDALKRIYPAGSSFRTSKVTAPTGASCRPRSAPPPCAITARAWLKPWRNCWPNGRWERPFASTPRSSS